MNGENVVFVAGKTYFVRQPERRVEQRLRKLLDELDAIFIGDRTASSREDFRRWIGGNRGDEQLEHRRKEVRQDVRRGQIFE